jgi:hypothetical protein
MANHGCVQVQNHNLGSLPTELISTIIPWMKLQFYRDNFKQEHIHSMKMSGCFGKDVGLE